MFRNSLALARSFHCKLNALLETMHGDTTNILGIPVPSTDGTFLAIVIVHIIIALVALISGIVAMLSEKLESRHQKAGKTYYYAMVISFALIIVLSVMRWPHNTHLLVIGLLAFGCAFYGRRMSKSKPSRWARLHTIFMGLSFVLLLTGFYVDNGKNLPFWNLFPQWLFYLLPSIIGLPIILKVLKNHPLNKR